MFRSHVIVGTERRRIVHLHIQVADAFGKITIQ